MTERHDGIPWIKISDATASGGRTIERTTGRILREGEERQDGGGEADQGADEEATESALRGCFH